jgi:hypothetical protein
MTVTLTEQRLGDQRWIVLSGRGPDAFRALGEHMRAEITAVAEHWDLLSRLRDQVADSPGRERLAAVRHASEAAQPEAWAELAALADGSGIPLADLALLNFRGDLGRLASCDPGSTAKNGPSLRPSGDGRPQPDGNPGSTATSEPSLRPSDGRPQPDGDPGHTSRGTSGGFGCSDLAWRGERSLLGHNEDGSASLAGQCALLTMAPDDEPPVTGFWYPVFLASNAFWVSGSGLVCSIDSLSVKDPGTGAGRHFVASGLQRRARTIDQAIGYLRGHPSAGGFSYTVGDRSGRIAIVESAAGQTGSADSGPGSPLLWHTNHARYVGGAEVTPGSSSDQRGRVLAALTPPADPDSAWLLRVLAGSAVPTGVRVDPDAGSDMATLCTFTADLTAGQAVLAPRSGTAVAIPLADLAEGVPGRQRALASASA